MDTGNDARTSFKVRIFFDFTLIVWVARLIEKLKIGIYYVKISVYKTK